MHLADLISKFAGHLMSYGSALHYPEGTSVNLAFIGEIREFFYTRRIGDFPKWSRTFIEFSESLLVLWEHPGLLQKRWQARALLMMSIFVTEFAEFSENI